MKSINTGDTEKLSNLINADRVRSIRNVCTTYMPNVYRPIILNWDIKLFNISLFADTQSTSLQHPIIVTDPKKPIRVCIKNLIGECMIKYKSTFSHGNVHQL